MVEVFQDTVEVRMVREGVFIFFATRRNSAFAISWQSKPSSRGVEPIQDRTGADAPMPIDAPPLANAEINAD
jgi:hypothetical protein